MPEISREKGIIKAIHDVPVKTIPDGATQKHVWRFAANIEVVKGSWCWNWVGTSRGNGYGCISVKDTPVPAHRFAYQMFVGEIPQGHHVHHECNNRRCVNPNHLKVVTPREHVKEHTPAATSSINAAKTHCIRGHLLEGENVSYQRGGAKRVCLACIRERDRAKRAAEIAVRPEKTHCRKGHPWTAENVGFNGRCGFCKVCHQIVIERFWQRKAESGEPYVVKRGRTHCRKGHELTPENLYIKPSGARFCKTCRDEYNTAYFASQRQKDRATT